MRKYYLTAVMLILASVLIRAQDEPAEGEQIDTIFTSVDLFEEEEPLQITLTFNMKQFQRTRFEGEYMPVQLSYHINDTLDIERSMRLRARGEFRRSHCSVAPFWLNIRQEKEGDAAVSAEGEINRIKIVTHCKASRAYIDYLLKEYLIYKIYNILSPVSFRVRLINMRYVDTGRKNRVTESWAFMIEPEEILADRFDALVIKNDELYSPLMRPEQMDLVSMFEFMIGNPDYSVMGRHNVKVLGLPGFGSEGYTPVPYDFDYTGAVNAYYAIPKEEFGIESVTERFFMGLCREEAEFESVLSYLEDHREEIMELIREFPYLDAGPERELTEYLESFYELASNRDRMFRLLNQACH